MEYKQLSKEFRDLFFKLNSLKNQPQEESIKLAFCSLKSISDNYRQRIEETSTNYKTGSEILFIKTNKEMITTKNGNRFFRVKSYNYVEAKINKMLDNKIELNINGQIFSFYYKSVFGVGCWLKINKNH